MNLLRWSPLSVRMLCFVAAAACAVPTLAARHRQAQGSRVGTFPQASVVGKQAPSQGAKPPRVERGFKGLFTGREAQLKDWTQINESGKTGRFVFHDGTLMATGGMGLLWYTPRSYHDFILRADWKAETAHSNSGIFVRFPDPQNDPWKPVNEGHEIQIADDYDPIHRTGSVYTFQPSTQIVSTPGQWNTLEIQVVGAHYHIRVNGADVCDYDSTRSKQGYIGLQNHNDADKVWFRNIRIRELKSKNRS